MPTTEWAIDGDAEWLFRQWGDECVVYSCVSGDTHLLDALGAASFTVLRQAPATSEDLARRAAFQLGLEPDEALLGMTEALLGDFERIGLVRQHPVQ